MLLAAGRIIARVRCRRARDSSSSPSRFMRSQIWQSGVESPSFKSNEVFEKATNEAVMLHDRKKLVCHIRSASISINQINTTTAATEEKDRPQRDRNFADIIFMLEKRKRKIACKQHCFTSKTDLIRYLTRRCLTRE